MSRHSGLYLLIVLDSVGRKHKLDLRVRNICLSLSCPLRSPCISILPLRGLSWLTVLKGSFCGHLALLLWACGGWESGRAYSRAVMIDRGHEAERLWKGPGTKCPPQRFSHSDPPSPAGPTWFPPTPEPIMNLLIR